MNHKIIYQIIKTIILLASGALIAAIYQCSNLPIWILFIILIFNGIFFQLFIFEKIEKKNNWGIWK